MTPDASERLIHAIFIASHEAIGVTRAGVHVLANTAMVRLFGYDSVEEFLGVNAMTLIAPAERPRIADFIARRSAGADAPDDYVTRGVRKDGTEFDVGARAVPYEMNGQIYTLVVLRDVTREVADRRALEESQAFYRALFEVNTAVHLLIDAEDGRIVDANPAAARFYGWDLATLRSMYVSDINTLPPEEIRREMRKLHDGDGRSYTFRHRRAGGDIADVEVYTGPVELRGRTMLLSIIHDVTDRKRLEAQVSQTQRMEALGRLAGGIAHDFNNLLGVVLAYADGLQSALPRGTKLASDAAHIVKAAMRAEELTQQLLALGRRQVLKPTRLRLREVVFALEGLLATTLGSRSTLLIQAAPEVGWVWADQGQLDQVLLNLIANARDAMPNGGTVTIAIRNADVAPDDAMSRQVDPGEWVVLSVSDTGVGMDPVTKTRIFEPFFTTKVATGTGLGLATVYGIIQQSRGRIYVVSEVGAGTTFTVWLPRVAPPGTAPVLVPVRSADATPKTVLVVEDEPDLREFVRVRLQAEGYTVLEASDGTEAIDVCARTVAPIHILVTDVVMPGMTGPEVYRRLALGRPALRVLFVSGWSDGLDEGDLPENAGFLGKPFTGQALIRAVAEVLSS